MQFKNIVLIFSSCLVMHSGIAQDSIRKCWYTSVYVKQSIAPAVLIGAGLFMKLNNTSFNDEGIQRKRQEHYPDFHSKADDYLRFAAVPVVYGFDWIGVKAKTDFINRSIILFKGELIMVLAVHGLKNVLHIERPDGSNNHSFPSGHAAQAFLAAVFLHKELGHNSVWFPITGYTIAATVGVMRVLNNEHWAGDVLVGAGIGMASMHVAYWTHQYKWNKNMSFMPVYYNKSFGLYAHYIF